MTLVKYILLTFVFIGLLFLAGCTGGAHDEQYKKLVTDALDQLDSLNEKIVKPYQGMTAGELSDLKSFAEQAKRSAEQMSLSDTDKKSLELFIRAMNATIEGVDSLSGALDPSTMRVDNTAPATNYFIQAQSDLKSAADIIKVQKKKE